MPCSLPVVPNVEPTKHVLEHRQPLERPRDLRGSADAAVAAHVGRSLVSVLAAEADGAVVGTQVTGDEVEQRGLAGAVGADDAEGLALGNVEREVLHHLKRAEALREVDDFQQCPHGMLEVRPAG